MLEVLTSFFWLTLIREEKTETNYRSFGAEYRKLKEPRSTVPASKSLEK